MWFKFTNYIDIIQQDMQWAFVTRILTIRNIGKENENEGIYQKASIIIFTCIPLINSMVAPIQANSDIGVSSALFVIESENTQLSSDLQVTTEIYGQPKPGYSGVGFVWMKFIPLHKNSNLDI